MNDLLTRSSRPFLLFLLLPSLIVLLLVVLYPFLFNVTISLSNMSMRHFTDWSVIGFRQYIKVFTSGEIWGVFGKTLIWTIVNVVFHVTIGVALALLLNRQLKGRAIIRTLLILPWAVPPVITGLVWRGMFNYEYGDFNLIVTKLLGMSPVNWLGDPVMAFSACILTNIWLGFPFMMVIALGGLQSIPQELYEAAEIDGANSWQRFKHITIPMLKPVMLPAITLGVVWTFNNLNIIWLVTNGGEPSDQSHILVSFVYKAAFQFYRYGFAAALSMVIFGLLAAFSWWFLWRTKAAEGVR
ncbi:MAG: sugar ABC transporter permease [bacterium]|nr:sugar ABC transporter permease [bacterium]